MKRMVPIFLFGVSFFILSCAAEIGTDSKDSEDSSTGNGSAINHNCAKLSLIPLPAINLAKSKLHIAYGHTSHGSQLIDGMNGLISFKGALYSFNNGGTGGALDVRDFYGNFGGSSAQDLGNPDRTSWETATRTYLDANPDINVVIWSWCGQVSSATSTDIDKYLSLMTGLENSYSNVTFVYMTGHLDGSGLTGNLHIRNDQIRAYCSQNKKWIYDFEDIESYDPDGIYFGDKLPTDACNYDSDGNGSQDKNWASDWQSTHVTNVDWYPCASAHSEPLNANQKAYAAWYLWARIAGWNGN